MVFQETPQPGLDLYTTFHVHPLTGFLPPTPPLARLSPAYEPWEAALDAAMTRAKNGGMKLGDDPFVTDEERRASEEWRRHVRDMPLLSVPEGGGLGTEEGKRRAHLVLAYLTHFYIHSLPLSEPVRIPASLSVPLLEVSEMMGLPPLLIYADTAIYNWYLQSSGGVTGGQAELPTTETIRTQVSFTGSIHEEEFYLCATRIELRGVEALSLMRSISHLLAEAYISPSSSSPSPSSSTSSSSSNILPRITSNLLRLSSVIQDLRTLLMRVREKCDPEVYYSSVRPWFRGEDSTPGREWVFEGGVYPYPARKSSSYGMGGGERELSGPSAGQSALIHLLDIFLGVDHTHSGVPAGMQQRGVHPNPSVAGGHEMGMEMGKGKGAGVGGPSGGGQTKKKSFMERMQTYMPTPHRLFLEYVKRDPYPLRPFVLSLSSKSTPSTTSSGEADLPTEAQALTEAYNTCVRSLKEFRDAHMIIATLYIVGPARREEKRRAALASASASAAFSRDSAPDANGGLVGHGKGEKEEKKELKGTGGTDLVKFLKDTRKRTEDAIVGL